MNDLRTQLEMARMWIDALAMSAGANPAETRCIALDGGKATMTTLAESMAAIDKALANDAKPPSRADTETAFVTFWRALNKGCGEAGVPTPTFGPARRLWELTLLTAQGSAFTDACERAATHAGGRA